VEEKKEKLSMKDLILLFFSTISARCWARLGLTEDEYGDFYQDLEEARLGIDTLDAIFNRIKDLVDEEVRREMEGVLSTLKLNYFHQYQKSKKKETENA
jgi:5-bromo-4-chloroindolyl phosphate hydrolysis protein